MGPGDILVLCGKVYTAEQPKVIAFDHISVLLKFIINIHEKW